MSLPVDRWHALSAEVVTAVADWRTQHPRATLSEIETALDERLARLRAQMLQDAALASARTDWVDPLSAEPPCCPDCDQPLQARGRVTRHLQTHGGQELALTRRYGTCPRCGGGLFPPG
jgi:hypothetical protein